MDKQANTDPANNRLRWQCRRGMLELDLLLEAFLEDQYPALADEDKQAFENLLSYPDQLLYDYLLGEAKPTDREIAGVVRRIRGPAAP